MIFNVYMTLLFYSPTLRMRRNIVVEKTKILDFKDCLYILSRKIDEVLK